MPKLPMLALAAVAAAVISVPASAGDRITIQTEVTKGGVVLSSGTQEISKGATAHFNDGRFKEIDTNVTVTCREGISRWLNPFKPACDKPTREKEKVPVCWRRPKIDPPCRLKIDPVQIADFSLSNCG